MNSVHVIRGQRGAALMMALLVLLVISIIGVSAMRSTAFSAKVALSTQLDALVFEAAESGVVETFMNLQEFNSSTSPVVFDQIAGLFNDETIIWCFLKDRKWTLNSCQNGEYFDSRDLLQVESRSQVTGFSPLSGSQVSRAGGSGVALFADYEVVIQGNGVLPKQGLQNRHIQHASRRGMIPQNEIR